MRFLSDTLKNDASLLSDEGSTLSVPITHLSHCTHDEQARQIEGDDEYRCFKACTKLRKNTHVYNVEERTTKLFDHHSVLPGYLSWWGISTIEWYHSDDKRGKETRDIVSTLAQKDRKTNERIFVPPYLQYCDGKANSVYGRNNFSSSIRNLIESYEQSRNGNGHNNPIYLKKAGTFRYINEICYVILVCTKKDLRNEDISSMPGACQPDTREMTYFNIDDESIAPDGELKTMEIKTEFISEYPICAIYAYNEKERQKFYSWDTLNFAFYFPEQ